MIMIVDVLLRRPALGSFHAIATAFPEQDRWLPMIASLPAGPDGPSSWLINAGAASDSQDIAGRRAESMSMFVGDLFERLSWLHVGSFIVHARETGTPIRRSAR